MNLTTTLFFQLWQETYEKRREEILPHWDSRGLYTKQMMAVLADIGDRLKLGLNTEYYSVDGILFEPRYGVQNKSSYYIINQKVVFEHENDANSIFSEVAHLLRLDAELYVVVGYHKAGGVDMDYLNSLLPMMQISHKSALLAEKRNFLVIMGDCVQYVSEGYWKGFIYAEDHWEPLVV